MTYAKSVIVFILCLGLIAAARCFFDRFLGIAVL